jgi:hypothetical protein
MRIDRYSTVDEYIAKAEAIKARGSKWDYNPYSGTSKGHSWDAGIGFEEACRRGREGDPSLVIQYTSEVDKLVNEFLVKDKPRRRYNPSMVGSRVSVPDYLAGSPLSMRRRMVQEIATRTVSIYVGIVCSAGIRSEQMIKRGCTILALLEYLNMSQVAVELYLLAETHGATDGDYIQVIKVESHPLNLSTAGFVIAHPAFARQVTYAMAYWEDHFNGMWPTTMRSWSYDNDRDGVSKRYKQELREKVGMQATDIYIPAPYLLDKEMIINKPELWLEQHIKALKENANDD